MIAKSANTFVVRCLRHRCVFSLTKAYYEDAHTVMESVPGDIDASGVASVHDC